MHTFLAMQIEVSGTGKRGRGDVPVVRPGSERCRDEFEFQIALFNRVTALDAPFNVLPALEYSFRFLVFVFERGSECMLPFRLPPPVP